jgi:threonine/homoserine/homoserine lactone efflux protein
LFFLAFLPQFVDINSAQATMHLIMLAAVFMVLTFVIFIGYGYSASMARDYVISKPSVIKWLKRSFALSFGLLGLKLAFGSDR